MSTENKPKISANVWNSLVHTKKLISTFDKYASDLYWNNIDLKFLGRYTHLYLGIEVLVYSFDWHSSDEGFEYWSQIDDYLCTMEENNENSYRC